MTAHTIIMQSGGLSLIVGLLLLIIPIQWHQYNSRTTIVICTLLLRNNMGGGDACYKVVDCYLLSFALAPALALGRNRSLASKSGKRDALKNLTPGNSSGWLLPQFIEAATAVAFHSKNIL